MTTSRQDMMTASLKMIIKFLTIPLDNQHQMPSEISHPETVTSDTSTTDDVAVPELVISLELNDLLSDNYNDFVAPGEVTDFEGEEMSMPDNLLRKAVT